MREILFRGKRKDNNKWIEGGYCYCNNKSYIVIATQYIPDTRDWDTVVFYEENPIYKPTFIEIYPESVGQYTGMKEFVVTDRSYNQPLFEGDIVEVWSTRRPCYSNPKSQYDGDVKVRAVICFTRGEWTLDYENNYNKSLTKLKGKEEDERTVDGDWVLYRFGCHGSEEWQREHNARYKWKDIVKLGNVFDNADLLEG